MEKINETHRRKRILIGPLDWGLGHVSRCIPLIRFLKENNCEVLVAADGNQEILIRSEFRDIAILRLDGYGISYSRKKAFFLWKILLQLPKIYRKARIEKKWVAKVTEEHQIDAIISDNRLGFYNKKIPSVFITHQLSVQTGFSFINTIARKIYYRYINRFSECWVPDIENENSSLSGVLSHTPSKPAIPLKYVGILSRFEKEKTEINNNILIVISGPEPQRSIFENIILKQLPDINTPVFFIRGLPNDNSMLETKLSHVTTYNHLSAEKMNSLIQSAGLVITRAGYSTVMDLVAINKNAVLVPTPGQTEQEYLAKHLFEQRYFLGVDQSKFSLKDIVGKAEKFEFKILPEMKLEKSILTDWLNSL